MRARTSLQILNLKFVRMGVKTNAAPARSGQREKSFKFAEESLLSRHVSILLRVSGDAHENKFQICREILAEQACRWPTLAGAEMLIMGTIFKLQRSPC